MSWVNRKPKNSSDASEKTGYTIRFYNIVLTNPANGALVKQYTSYDVAKQQSIPGALNVEMDLVVYPYNTPAGNSFVRVWGISLQDISQASNLTNMNISVFGGMQKGLPLANPSQAGLLVQGSVLQSFANWLGVSQTLDLIVTAGSGSASAPGGTGSPAASANIPVNWKAGMPMGVAIKNALATSFPNLKPNVNISNRLVQAFDEIDNYQSLTQFAQYLAERSKAIMGGSYLGVHTSIAGNSINVFDGTVQTGGTKQIAFSDLIGQPTWFAPSQLQLTVVMRADIAVGDTVQLPPVLTTTQAGSYNSILRNNSVFQGTAQVLSVRHVGNLRQPQGEAWVTTLQAVINPSSSPSRSAGNAVPVLVSQ